MQIYMDLDCTGLSNNLHEVYRSDSGLHMIKLTFDAGFIADKQSLIVTIRTWPSLKVHGAYTPDLTCISPN